MSEDSKQIIKSNQCARIILCLSEMYNISIDEATDMYYQSETANMIEEGIADLHCRSDKYLAEEIWGEYNQTSN
ncbi:MAG: DUF3791 domain-containing protein [Paludibacteraceae bacterium]|nr:DUF3791 domain-containing protein [Paludibacteraceae bacterium]